MSEKIKLNLELNTGFIDHLHELMHLDNNTYPALDHIKNALELYAKIIESMAEGNVPVMVNPNSTAAERIELPIILAMYKQSIELQDNKYIDLKRNIL